MAPGFRRKPGSPSRGHAATTGRMLELELELFMGESYKGIYTLLTCVRPFTVAVPLIPL
jgi:hypothetical protein